MTTVRPLNSRAGLSATIELMSSSGASASESDLTSGDAGTMRPARAEHAKRVGACFKDNHARIVRWLELKSGSLATARDVANEAFTSILELHRPVADLTPYVYKVAANILARRRQIEATHRRLDVRISSDANAAGTSPEPQLAELQQSQVLHAALDTLPPRVRLAVRLRFWEEKSYAEIVQHFHDRGIVVHVRTVMRWIARAIEHCREAMQEAGER